MKNIPPLISIQDATKGFGVKPLFCDMSLALSEGERIALIGGNGSGKSTLLKILAGIEELDSGEVSARKDIRRAYVPQLDILPEDLSVSEVIEQFLAAEGFDYGEIARRSSVYSGMAGFTDTTARVSTLSGGWRKRLAIAKALAVEPDLLLLDEPTNHLDIDSIEWLEDLLRPITCSIVFVSHDRYFIEALADRVIEINTVYAGDHLVSSGGYADYLEYREEMLAQLSRQKRSLANKTRREVEWLRQGVKARTTKSKARIAEAHRLLDKLHDSPSTEKKRIEIDFSTTSRKTKELVKIQKLSQSVGGTRLFKDVSLVLSPGTRLAIVGPNGSGKTTLVKTLLGILPPESGKVIHAPQLRVTFLDQARSQLHDNITLKEFLAPHGDSIVFQGQSIHVAAWAARFLFSNEHLGRMLGSLSGGERARALLARSISEVADILVFDEPTNDLDIATLENLEEGFESFPGAIVLITHDRFILDRMASLVLGLLDGSASLFGSYRQWELFRKQTTSTQRQQLAEPSHKHSPSVQHPKKLSYKHARELSMIEDTIMKAEATLGDIQNELDSGRHATNSEKLAELCDALATQQAEVERLYARWQELEALQEQGKGDLA